MGATTRRLWLAPEVIQTSAMDCGPASLKCLLDGFGIPVNYARLREACQTDVDGTSIDTLEQIARQFGLDAEQVMLPPEDLLLPEARALPALVVTTLPGGATHFVVAWRAYAGLVQVMDPGCGRRWLTSRAFLSDVYRHRLRVSAHDWREYAASDEARSMLARRCEGLGVDKANRERLTAEAFVDSDWQRPARFDAALRLTASMVRSRVLKRGAQADSFLAGLCRKQNEIASGEPDPIPDACWSVRPNTDAAESSAVDAQIVHRTSVNGYSLASRTCSPTRARCARSRLRRSNGWPRTRANWVWIIEMAGHARYTALLDACVLFPLAMGTASRNAVQFVI
jgi:predicted double-glycine peptidase